MYDYVRCFITKILCMLYILRGACDFNITILPRAFGMGWSKYLSFGPAKYPNPQITLEPHRERTEKLFKISTIQISLLGRKADEVGSPQIHCQVGDCCICE